MIQIYRFMITGSSFLVQAVVKDLIIVGVKNTNIIKHQISGVFWGSLGSTWVALDFLRTLPPEM